MIKVSDNYYVSPQISEEDLDYFKNEGFSLVVCNRPNGEEDSQIDFEIIQKRCESMGLTIINLPMVPGNLESDLILQTKKSTHCTKAFTDHWVKSLIGWMLKKENG